MLLLPPRKPPPWILTKTGVGASDLASHTLPQSSFAEAFRNLRTSLLLAAPDHQRCRHRGYIRRRRADHQDPAPCRRRPAQDRRQLARIFRNSEVRTHAQEICENHVLDKCRLYKYVNQFHGNSIMLSLSKGHSLDYDTSTSFSLNERWTQIKTPMMNMLVFYEHLVTRLYKYIVLERK